MGVCDDGRKAGGACDGAAGAAGGSDIRGVELAECCKHTLSNFCFQLTCPGNHCRFCCALSGAASLSALDFHGDHLSHLHQFLSHVKCKCL